MDIEQQAQRRRADVIWRDVRHDARAHAVWCALWATLRAEVRS